MAVQRCAQILNGVVDNVIEADPAIFQPADGSLIVATGTAESGWTYAGGVFSPPAVAPPVYQTTGLTFLQFMALFTLPEQSAIVGSADTQVRLFLLMATGSSSVDLTNPELVAGVSYLASTNLIASARVPAILAGQPPA